MKKKRYESPQCEAVTLDVEAIMLEASDNDYTQDATSYEYDENENIIFE